MSVQYVCDICEKCVDDENYVPQQWLHDSDYDTDFCSPRCHEEWYAELEKVE